MGVPHFNALAGGDLCEYSDKLYLCRIVLPDAENRTIVSSYV